MFGALTVGATLCVAPERIRVNPEKMVDWLADARITLLQTVPSFARELLAAAHRQGATAHLAALDHLLLAGETLPGELAAELRAAMPDTRLVNLYGTTESILSTWHEVTAAVAGPVPVGTPIPGRQVLVLDEHDQPCPTGVTGQIVVHSPYVTTGYLGAEAADDAVFRPVPDGDRLSAAAGRWHRTGDLGRRRWDGLLEYRGRRDQQIKFNGVRLELDEVEAVLAAQPSVADCAVVGVTGPHGRIARLVAYVVAQPAAGADPPMVDAWRSAVRRHLGAVKVPVLFRTVPSLPRNAGGKVDRRRLPDPGASGAGPARALRPPVEPALAAIWAELLGGEPRDPQLTFAAAGGHSMLVPVLLDRIRSRFGVEVPIWTYYEDPTLAGLAAVVLNRTAPGAAAPATGASGTAFAVPADFPAVPASRRRIETA
jgi:acyl-coenzyme A synthetase/AMP-(fatty) acid ligase